MDVNIKMEPKENGDQSIIIRDSLPVNNAVAKKEIINDSEPNQRTEKNDNTKVNNCFQCKICPYNTFRKPFLEKHMTQKHGFLKINTEKNRKRISRRERVDNEIRNSNNSKIEEKAQLDSSNGYESITIGGKQWDCKNRDSNPLKTPEEGHECKEEEVYQCIQCKFKTKEINALRDHEKTHKTLTLFSCSKCDYATRQKCNLRAHLRVHEDPKKLERFSCETCKKFVSFHYSALLRHVKLKHGTGEGIFKCDKCPFSTKIQKRFSNHQKHHANHNDMPMFKCEKCDFVTYNEQTIQRHVLRHEEREKVGEELIVKEQTKEKEIIWFCCNICDFRSKDQRYVILHKKVHMRVDEINKVGESIVLSERKKTEGSESSSGSS